MKPDHYFDIFHVLTELLFPTFEFLTVRGTWRNVGLSSKGGEEVLANSEFKEYPREKI